MDEPKQTEVRSTDPWVNEANTEYEAYKDMFELEVSRAVGRNKYSKSTEELERLADAMSYKRGIAEYRQIATETNKPIVSVDAEHKLL